MSTTSDVFPASLALLGGIPIKSQDSTMFVSIFLCSRASVEAASSNLPSSFFPRSIILTVVYSVLVVGALFRVAVRASRCLTLLRPVVFIILRVPTFGIRAIQANGHYSQGLFIAEQVRPHSYRFLDCFMRDICVICPT
jgi:hypothetical protein